MAKRYIDWNDVLPGQGPATAINVSDGTALTLDSKVRILWDDTVSAGELVAIIRAIEAGVIGYQDTV